MNLIELHILQSFPVSCLNRDDVGSPKSATFGGVTRARLSSQSLKRAVRLNFNEEHYGDAFHTTRTKLAHETLIEELTAGGLSEESAAPMALEVMSRLVDQAGASKAKIDRNGRMNMPALIWLSPSQFIAAAKAMIANKDTIMTAIEAAKAAELITNKVEKNKAEKAAKKAQKEALDPVTKEIQKAGISDAADIAFFGRMVANDPSLNVEGASMFSHALSTHQSSNEIDFYTAVDDVKQRDGENDEVEGEEAGAGMIGTLEFNSATYYRYTAINLKLLFDKKHLDALPTEDRKSVLRSFIRSLLIAVPGARQNSMNAATLPFEVLGIRKTKGQPLQLANAFESPVKANGKGLQAASLTAMKEHLDSLEKTWGSLGEKLWLTETGLESFLDQLLATDV